MTEETSLDNNRLSMIKMLTIRITLRSNKASIARWASGGNKASGARRVIRAGRAGHC